eukprot:TRINITY_DN38062_c0_g2_i1.p1 TRINITY_DN38062_c0_g2~~TRINITY_DN38062_c0_g2_i1.p1  ORF type:complete len:647 (+),score=125.11 TRINITY_DN38062_c0_g2_i1:69-2009(+)
MTMLRKFLGNSCSGLGVSEETAVDSLAATHRRLLADGTRLTTKTDAGYNACVEVLEGLETVARAMRLEATSRSYRKDFTPNYRALFPDEARSYRVDVLEASLEQYAVIWVNGDKFEFSVEAMRRAEALQAAFKDLGGLLERWYLTSEQRRPTVARPTRMELQAALLALDLSWANFEQKYISELIGIEARARSIVVEAVAHERSLQKIEAQCRHDKYEDGEFRTSQKLLAQCIARLNSVANFKRKGRDDLTVGVLEGAAATLRRCDSAERLGILEPEDVEAFCAARILASDVVDAFAAVREYLAEVEHCMERVDPHLCNNAGLVARLVDWEESWEIGARYVQNQSLLDAVCDVVALIRAGQRLVPALGTMCEECDVELFLVLPRMIWLRYLMRPGKQVELLRSLLPHRFLPQQIPARSVRIGRSPSGFGSGNVSNRNRDGSSASQTLAAGWAHSCDVEDFSATGGELESAFSGGANSGGSSDVSGGGTGGCPNTNVDVANGNGIAARRSQPSSSSSSAPWRPDADLSLFCERFRRAQQFVAGAMLQTTCEDGWLTDERAEAASHDLFVRRIVSGSGDAQDPYASLPTRLREGIQSVVEDFMLELERWSIELQRHNAEDWNQCSAILVQCLTTDDAARQKQPAASFKV